MSMLTDTELRAMARDALAGAMVENWETVTAALKPLWQPTGDAGDGYLLITLLIDIVLDALPHAECPEHGRSCLRIRFALKGADGMTPLPDGFDADPAATAYMAMVKGVFAEDADASIAAYCEALQADAASGVLWLALRNAGYALRQKLSWAQ